MSSWNQNQQPMTVGQAQFNPYWGIQQPALNGNYNTYGNTARLPVYNAAPIHGQNAAWQFPMGANSEIYLPDADQDIIWWIRTDANGNKSVQAFDVVLHKEPEPVDMNEVLARLGAVEEWINAKSNKSNAKRNAATTVAATTVAATE